MLLHTFLPLLLTSTVGAATLSQVLAANNDTLSTLNMLLSQAPQLASTLSQARNVTVLAPSDDAFTRLIRENPSSLQMASNPAMVSALLQYHVIQGVLPSRSFPPTPQFFSTLLASPPFVNVTGGQKLELVSGDGKALIFSGFKQRSSVTKSDIIFDGGVLHIIDTVLTIPTPAAAAVLDLGLTSLAGALARTGQAGSINALKDTTIFAPSNAAFDAIGSAANALSPQDLASILSYHVLTNQVRFSGSLAAEGSLTTSTGAKVTVRVQNGQVFLNSARVVTADIIVGNGVVHIIDGVLNPSASTLAPNPSLTTQPPAFPGAIDVGDPPFTAGVVPTTTIVPDGIGAGGREVPALGILSFLLALTTLMHL